jgi:tripartite-type tricarboxylate transporter receptor subunit TctC
MILNILRKTAVALTLLALTQLSWAQAYPSRPIKIIVPYGPGTAIDVIVRHLSEALTRQMGQPIIVENKAGASGTIGTAFVATSAPDGYTILSDASTHTSGPAMLGKVPYDPVRDFAGITTITESTLVLVVAKSSGINSVADLVAAGKAKPGALTYASAGVGSSTHMTVEKFNAAAGIKALHVPFKSTTDGLTEVLAGRVSYTYTGVASAVPMIRDNRLVPLAVGGFRRSAALPGISTIEEAGIAGAGYPGWLGLMLPVKTPRDIVMRLHAEVTKAMTSPDMKEELLKAGTDAWIMSPEEFDAMLKREMLENEKLVKELNLKVQ